MLVIVAAGFLIALTLKYILRALLHLTKLDRLSEEAGASHALRMAALPSITELLSQSVFWVTWSGFVLIEPACSCCGFAGTDFAVVSAPAGDFCGHFDSVFGTGDREFLSRAVLLAAVNAGYRSPKMLSWSVHVLVWILAGSMALEEIGIARQTVVAAFSIVFGALMLGWRLLLVWAGGTWLAGFWRGFSDRRRKKNMKSRNRCVRPATLCPGAGQA